MLYFLCHTTPFIILHVLTAALVGCAKSATPECAFGFKRVRTHA